MSNSSDLSNFITYGYFLDKPIMPLFQDIRLTDSVSSPKRLFELLAEKIYARIKSSSDFVIPLSGGVDSRLVLALTAQVMPVSDVKTYTFGQSGSMDYTIGNLIANKAGTQHTEFDLSDYIPTLSDIAYNLEKTGKSCFSVMSTPYSLIDNVYGSDIITLSGFMGDPVAGSKLKRRISNPRECFHADNKITRFNTAPDLSMLVEQPRLPFSDYENIDFLNRQLKYVRPHVMPNDNFYSPFLEPEFVSYFARLEPRERYNCRHYFKLCLECFPFFFGFPVKNRYMESLRSNLHISKLRFLFKTVHGSKYDLRRARAQVKLATSNYFDYKCNLQRNPGLKKIVVRRYNDVQRELIRSGHIQGVGIPYEEATSLEVSVLVSLSVIMHGE